MDFQNIACKTLFEDFSHILLDDQADQSYQSHWFRSDIDHAAENVAFGSVVHD